MMTNMRNARAGLLRASMMTPMERRAGRFMRAPDHADATAAPAADPAPEPESILFPGEGDQADGQPQGDKPADQSAKPDAGEWKPYENDPAKSDAENAAAKVEHDKADPNAVANKVPEDGKYEITLPEGVELDAELADALMPEFKELGLTNAQAQKLAEKYAAAIQAKAEKQGEGWANTISKWADDAKADKEIGGDKWDATVATSRRAVEALGTPALRDYLNASGGGNHPEVIRFMSKVGGLLKEDNPAGGGSEGSGQRADPAHILFPSDAPKG